MRIAVHDARVAVRLHSGSDWYDSEIFESTNRQEVLYHYIRTILKYDHRGWGMMKLKGKAPT